jgi:hypothetical protein
VSSHHLALAGHTQSTFVTVRALGRGPGIDTRAWRRRSGAGLGRYATTAGGSTAAATGAVCRGLRTAPDFAQCLLE